MRALFLCLALLLFVSLHTVVAQTSGPQLAKVTPPSPTQKAMQKYGDIPVSPYTGVPTISIPLYTVKFRDITVPVSLSYHASGIKVTEEASQTGLGWSLNAGGSISRNIVGGDDLNGSNYLDPTIMDFSNGQGPTRNVQYGCTPEFYNHSIANQPTIYNLDLSSYFSTIPAKDFQPDQFYFNFLDNTGKFLLKRTKEVVLQKQEKIQLTMLNGGNAWQARSVDGYTYDFAQYETSSDGAITQLTAWYLTKITSPTGNQVTFNYTALPNRFITPVGGYAETRDDFQTPGIFSSATISGTNLGYKYGPIPGKYYSLIVLSSIDFTNGVVTFNYSDNRSDLPGDKRLDSVSIFTKDGQGNVGATPIRTIAMTYDYFNGPNGAGFSTGSGNPALRLKLLQVQEKGYYNGQAQVVAPYVFSYYEGDNFTTLPAKTSFARDHWGYYNGKLSNQSLIPSVIQVNSTDPIVALLGKRGPERDVDTNYIKAFSLHSIQYPTGGSTEFQYETNDFDEQQSQVNDNSYFRNNYDLVQQSSAFTYDAVARQVVGSDTLNISNEYTNPSQGGTTNVSVTAAFRFSSGSCSNVSFYNDNQIWFELYDSTGTNRLMHVDPADVTACSGGSTNACLLCNAPSPVFSYTNTINLPPGKYIWKAYSSNSGYAAGLQDIHVTFSWYVEVSSSPNYNTPGSPTFFYAGGLRVKRIIDHDAINPANDKVKKFVYHYFADKNNSGTPQEYSYGRRMSAPEYAYFDLTHEFIECNCPQNVVWQFYSGHLMRSSDSDNPLNGSAAGSVVGYDQVTELYGENGENGETVFQYINSPDIVYGYYPVIQNAYIPTGLPARPPYGANVPDMMNGSLISQNDYTRGADGVFVPVKQLTNSYTTVNANENLVFGMERRIPQDEYYSQSTPVSGPPNVNCDVELFFYTSMKSDWNYLASTDEKIYDSRSAGSYTETRTAYSYNNANHMQLTDIATTNSKQEQVLTHIQYPLDFTNLSGSDAFTQGIINLQNNHVINAPIEKFVQKKNADGTNLRTVSAFLTSYKVSQPLPDIGYQFQLPAPAANFAAATTSASGLTMDPSYKPLVSFDQYDANGNIIQQHKVSDLSHCYSWDYHNSLVGAEVTGAVPTDVAFTSFEADGSGNWTLGGGSVNVGTGFTGKNSYNLTGSIFKSGLNSSTTYIVSYWSQGGAMGITGTVAGYPRKGKTITIKNTPWTLYVHKVTGQSTITVSGPGTVDELRLYPATAQMTTYTYDPLIGMTSQTDAGNRATYYEYDGLARLKRVRDQDYNILKTFDYQYQASAGCGNGCYFVPLQTLAGTATLGYPVGVFNVNGKLLGNATGPQSFANVWNSDTADARIGTLAPGGDSLHFNLTLNAGQVLPASVTGCRYYQVDLAWNQLDAVRNINAAYVAFGDGTGMRLGRTPLDTANLTLAPGTVLHYGTGNSAVSDANFYIGYGPYYIHTYADSSLKTITFYHNDGTETPAFDPWVYPATSLFRVTNFRGNYPQHMPFLGGTSYQQPGASSVAGVSNWSSISSITTWYPYGGYYGNLIDPWRNMRYAQDFLAADTNLTTIRAANGSYYTQGYADTTFTLSRLKSNWNTYFTKLTAIAICEDQWNHEDLSVIPKLNYFNLIAANQYHSNVPGGNPIIPLASGEIDTIFNQIAAGSGQHISGGFIVIHSGGSAYTSQGVSALNYLKSKGWTIYLNGVIQ